MKIGSLIRTVLTRTEGSLTMDRGRLGFVAVAVVLCGVAIAATAVYSQDDVNKKALQALQGTWEAKSIISRGEESKITTPTRMIIAGNQMRLQVGGRETSARFELAVDATKTPHTMNVLILEPKVDKGKKWLLLYELKGNQLRTAESEGQELYTKRPTNLSGKGNSVTLYVKVKK